MAVGSTRSAAPATTAAPAPMVMMGRLAARGELAGDVADGLNQFLGHPTDGGEDLPEGQTRQDPPALLDAVFALAGGPFFQCVVDLVTDPAGLLNRLYLSCSDTWSKPVQHVGIPLSQVCRDAMLRTAQQVTLHRHAF